MRALLFSWVSSSLGSFLNQKARGETPSAQSTHGCEEAGHSSAGHPMNIRNNSPGFGYPSTSIRWATPFFLYFCVNILQIPLSRRSKDAAGFTSSKTKKTGIFLYQIPVFPSHRKLREEGLVCLMETWPPGMQLQLSEVPRVLRKTPLCFDATLDQSVTVRNQPPAHQPCSGVTQSL